MSAPFIDFADGERNLDWIGLTDALVAGHEMPRAEIADSFLYRGNDTVLSRAAWIDGMGIAVKTATVFPGNAQLEASAAAGAGNGAQSRSGANGAGTAQSAPVAQFQEAAPASALPTINGGVSLFEDRTGALAALVDFHLVTKWKTAGDSLLGALRLARSDSREILVVGAGTVGESVVEAFGVGFPRARISVWNRTRARAERLAARHPGVAVAAGGEETPEGGAEDANALDAGALSELESAVRSADIVVSATMAREPLIRGEWLRPGQHLNLIGAFKPDMREADDEALRRARIHVDSRATTLDHIGELKDPISRGVIGPGDVIGDFYELGRFQRGGGDEITLFKNGGGAHLDLMTADYILRSWRRGHIGDAG